MGLTEQIHELIALCPVSKAFQTKHRQDSFCAEAMEEGSDVQLVRALVDNPALSVDYERKFEGLEKQQSRRKDSHDATLHEFQQTLATISDKLEAEVRYCRQQLNRSAEADSCVGGHAGIGM